MPLPRRSPSATRWVPGILLALLAALTLGTACTATTGSGDGAPSAGPGATGEAAVGTAPHALEANATVVAVVDGDTIDARFGDREERIRLIGIDTPETKRPDTPVQCYGPEAADFTARMLPVGTAIRVERDVENRDAYGRLLGYVHRAADGVFVNYELVRQGFATPLSIEPNVAHARRFVVAAQEAELADAGLWARCSG